jgi:hypothetical protein
MMSLWHLIMMLKQALQKKYYFQGWGGAGVHIILIRSFLLMMLPTGGYSLAKNP